MFNFGVKSIFNLAYNVASKIMVNDKNLITQPFNAFNKNYAIFAPYKRGVFASSKGPRAKHYKPKVMKRIQAHGLATRLETRGGKQILWRKIIQGPKGWMTFVAAP